MYAYTYVHHIHVCTHTQLVQYTNIRTYIQSYNCILLWGLSLWALIHNWTSQGSRGTQCIERLRFSVDWAIWAELSPLIQICTYVCSRHGKSVGLGVPIWHGYRMRLAGRALPNNQSRLRVKPATTTPKMWQCYDTCTLQSQACNRWWQVVGGELLCIDNNDVWDNSLVWDIVELCGCFVVSVDCLVTNSWQGVACLGNWPAMVQCLCGCSVAEAVVGTVLVVTLSATVKRIQHNIYPR